MKLFGTSKGVIYDIIRSLAYASLIASILFILVLFQKDNYKNLYPLFSFIGLGIVLVESFFIVNHTNVHRKQQQYFTHSFWQHGIHHILYPLVSYCGAVLFIYLEKNYLITTSLSIVLFFLFWAGYYYTTLHLRHGHVDTVVAKKASAKHDFILYLAKLCSFFIVALALFKAYELAKLSLFAIAVIFAVTNALYLYAHISRKHEVNILNVAMVILFAVITSLAIINITTYKVSYSASIATVLFYVSSGIFYHKVDGTLDYRVLMEYGSIALLLSIFLFNV